MLVYFDNHPPEVFTHYFGDPDTSWLAAQFTLNGLVELVATSTRVALTATFAATLSQSKWIWFAESSRGPGHSQKLGDLESFDQASRGQWGSLMLLCKMNCGKLACVGAALTILTLGFNVFSQQILGLQDRLVPDATAIASVPRSEFYDLFSCASHTAFYPALSMKASIQTGIMIENIPEISVHSSSGNCTWPTIPILTVCGACTDVTANLSRTNTQYPDCYEYTLPNEYSWTGPGPDFFTSPTAPVDIFVSNQQLLWVDQEMNDVGDQPLYTAKLML